VVQSLGHQLQCQGFLEPVDFLILARLFWNQILICASFRPNSLLSSWRLRSVRYRFSLNSRCKWKKWNAG
nr:homeo box gene 48A anti [Drosophila melanogaster]